MNKRLYGCLWGITLFIAIAAFFVALQEPEPKPAVRPKPGADSFSTTFVFPSSPAPPPKPKRRKGIYVKTWDWKYSRFGSPYIEGVVVNDSDTTYRFVEVQFEVLNTKGERLDIYTDSTTYLEPYGRWRFRVYVYDISDQPEVQARFLKLETSVD